MSMTHVKNDHDIKNDNGDHLISGGKYIFSKEEYSKWVKSLKKGGILYLDQCLDTSQTK
ncbi:hypothetical protein RhiirA4_481573 [Rhizophagus irregularis]|uniref:Uncharacterized protein n=1 Tax=Rhizophagus irregularis TaxID=588596 RepID=A0A2I1HJS8_9GLOM|nr:hypothetical protein RhiirA4_481573 [Rhizophagus irregularis]